MAIEQGIIVRGRVEFDTSQAENSISNLGQKSQQLARIPDNQLPALVESPGNNEALTHTTEKLQNLAENLGKSTEATSSFISSLDDIKDILSGIQKNLTPNSVPALSGNLPGSKQNQSEVYRSIINLEKNLPQQIAQATTGNVMGVGANMLSGGTSSLIGMFAKLGGPLGLAIAGIGGLALGGLKVANDAEKKYEEALPGIDKLLSAYSDNPTGNSADVNAALGLGYREGVTAYNQNTGLENNEFVDLTSSFGKYGVTSAIDAAQLAQKTAQYARLTNGDNYSISEFLGTASRYGSGNALGDLDYAYGAAMASGMSRNQFPEFLQSIERVIEDSVSKGYAKSTKEVADTLVMFDKLSGGSEYWKGEQGANRLLQINNGLASATSLGNTGQLLAYQALKGKGETVVNGGNWINDMIYMEQGLNADNFRSIMNQLDNTYGNDIESKIMAIKQITGLNYTGAAQLYKMGLGNATNDEITTTINDLMTSANMESDSTRMANILAKIDSEMVNIGHSVFDVKVMGLETIESLLGIIAKDSMESSKKELYSSGTKYLFEQNTEKNKINEFKDNFNELWSSSDDRGKIKLLEIMGKYSGMNYNTGGAFNLNNLESDISFDSVESFVASMNGAYEKAVNIGSTYRPGDVTRTRYESGASLDSSFIRPWAEGMALSEIIDANKPMTQAFRNKGGDWGYLANLTSAAIDLNQDSGLDDFYKSQIADTVAQLYESGNLVEGSSIFKSLADLGENGYYSDVDIESLLQDIRTILNGIMTSTKATADNTSTMEVVTHGGNTFSSPML